MTYLIETADRVLEVTAEPDTPGWCRRTIKVAVVSGPLLSLDEYERLSAWAVAELVGSGAGVHSWKGVPG